MREREQFGLLRPVNQYGFITERGGGGEREIETETELLRYKSTKSKRQLSGQRPYRIRGGRNLITESLLGPSEPPETKYDLLTPRAEGPRRHIYSHVHGLH